MYEDRIANIRRNGKVAQGQKELIMHLEGDRLSIRQAIKAQCYDCSGFYIDGKIDCRSQHCPLYPFMVYNARKVKRKIKITKTHEHMQKMRSAKKK
jgi:hypothetical protein